VAGARVDQGWALQLFIGDFLLSLFENKESDELSSVQENRVHKESY